MKVGGKLEVVPQRGLGCSFPFLLFLLSVEPDMTPATDRAKGRRRGGGGWDVLLVACPEKKRERKKSKLPPLSLCLEVVLRFGPPPS